MISEAILKKTLYFLLSSMSKHKKHDKKVVKKEDLISDETTSDASTSKTTQTKKDDAKQFADTASKKAKEMAHDAEEKIDEVTKKAKAYVTWQWKEDYKELEKETVSKVNKVADGVEHLGEWYEDLVESIFPSDHKWSRIVYNAERNENVDRWVLVRMLWSIIIWPVITIRWARIALIWIVYMVKIITSGKRDRVLWNKMIRFANYILNWDAYMGGLIDRRPEIIE